MYSIRIASLRTSFMCCSRSVTAVSVNVITAGQYCVSGVSVNCSLTQFCIQKSICIQRIQSRCFSSHNDSALMQPQKQQRYQIYSDISGVSIDTIREKSGFIIDMDGVMYHGENVMPGAAQFIEFLLRDKKEFIFLTNSSTLSPLELKKKLSRLNIMVDEKKFYTSAQATASFMAREMPNGGSAFVIGEPALVAALHDAGFTSNSRSPDFVVVGETPHYHYDQIAKAISLVRNGARLLGTNVDIADRIGNELVPGCGALIKPIELVSEVKPYFIGKPNPLMMRAAQRKFNSPASKMVVIGDRMNTDILGGMQTEMTTVLVLSGVTKLSHISSYAFRPDIVLPDISHICH